MRNVFRLTLTFAAALMSGCANIPPAAVAASSDSTGKLAVFDIDGTLTPHNLFVFEARPGAAEAVRAYAGKGYLVVYITTRSPLFQAGLPAWLIDHGFPPGLLHVAQNKYERDHAAAFKSAVLAQYTRAGWQLGYAYGDSPSDFEAYAAAGLARTRVFALKRRFYEDCVGDKDKYVACLDGWVGHLPAIQRDVAPAR